MSESVAIVFGGGGVGSGRAVARRFAREGWVAIVGDVDPAAGKETLAAVAGDGGRAFFREVDVSSPEQLIEAFAYARGHGRVAAVVNNASPLDAIDFDHPLDHWERLATVEFLGAMRATRLAIDAFRESGGGAVVNVSSTSALLEHRQSGSPMYDVAKLAVLRLSQRLAFLREENIRVNCIVPHWIAVPEIVEYVATLSPGQRKERGVPDRLIPVDEIADAVFRLATDHTLAGEAIVWPDGNDPVILSEGER